MICNALCKYIFACKYAICDGPFSRVIRWPKAFKTSYKRFLCFMNSIVICHHNKWNDTNDIHLSWKTTDLCLQGPQLTYTGFQCMFTSRIIFSSLRPASAQVLTSGHINTIFFYKCPILRLYSPHTLQTLEMLESNSLAPLSEIYSLSVGQSPIFWVESREFWEV